MPRGSYVKVSTDWKKAVNIWLNVGGTWKQKVKSFREISGAWKLCVDYAPGTPTGLGVSQDANAAAAAVWNSVTDADGYKLQRRPQWNGSSWVNTWKDVYTGASTSHNDDIVSEHQPDEVQQFDYQVAAYSGSEVGTYSSVVTIYWATGT